MPKIGLHTITMVTNIPTAATIKIKIKTILQTIIPHIACSN